MTEVMPPPDAAARDRIREDLGATLFVEAGAGTGKTTALVGRLLGLVRGGVEPRRIAAITFTEAAAAQLRDRVRVALEHAAADPAMDPVERERCDAGLRQLDEASILTLHGFAQQLLADHPLEAGLPPEFEVLDELRAAEAFEEAWRALLDELLAEPELAEPIETCLALGMSLVRLEQLALQLVAEPDRATPPAAESGPDGDALLGRLLDGLDGLRDLAGWCVRPDALLDHLRDLERLRGRLLAAEGIHRLRLLHHAAIRCNKGRKEGWDGRSGEVKERLRELDELREACLLAHGRRALAPLLERMGGWAVAEAGRRRRQGTLTFHDLLVTARALLLERPAVRRVAAERWSHLLIDEFQDTDPLQIEIALALKGDGEADAPWPSRHVPDGSLFFVGDPKQSIYRFRRADIAVYQAARERFGAGHVRLSASFRAVPGAVEWVNAVFGPLLDGRDGQAPFQPLDPVRPSLPGTLAPPVRVLGGPAADNPGAEVLRAREADAVARAIVAARAEAWPVAAGHGGQGEPATRPLAYADIAILLPARTALAAIERALEDHGVPYRVEASSLVYESQEVRELVALLRAVDDPTDQLAVIAALRGPAFACTDPDLARWAETRHGWDYRAANGQDDGPVANAMAVLRELHDARRRLDPAALLDHIVRERRLFAIALARPRPRDSWRRLRFLLDEARAFAETGGTLRELVRRLERQADDQVRVTEQVLPDEDDDAVRILTVHAAKGLEFPVAILAGMSARGRGGANGPALWDADGLPAIRLGDPLETENYAQAKADDDQAEERERIRLLYVAATRARDHLILALHHVPAKTGRPTSAELLWQACQDAHGLWAAWDPPAGAPGRALDHTPRLGGPVDPAAWHSERETALRLRAAAPVISATALAAASVTGAPAATTADTAAPPRETDAADADAVRADDDTGEGLPQLPPFRRGRAGTAVGRAVHATQQTVDLPAATRLRDTARAQAEAEGLPERAAEIETLSRSALDSEPVREALAGGRWWRELAVVATVDGVLLEGYLDLLYEDELGRLVLVDYKTDRLPDGDAAPHALLPRYRVQLGAYALAVSATLGRPVDRAALVFLAPGQARTHWLDDLDAATAEARQRLRAAFSATAPTPPAG